MFKHQSRPPSTSLPALLLGLVLHLFLCLTLAHASSPFEFTALPDGVRLGVKNGHIVSMASSNKEWPVERFQNLIPSRYEVGSLDGTDVTPELWRSLEIDLILTDGRVADLKLLRPLWWIEPYELVPNAEFEIDVEELGIEGIAYPKSIGPCEVDSRDNNSKEQIITGWIRQPGGVVQDLLFEGSDTPLGLTASHPLFSADRHDWVPAGDLRVGESVQLEDGTAKLKARTTRPKTEDVFNLEVHRAHHFFVGDQSILAHNARLGKSAMRNVRKLEGEVGRANALMAEGLAADYAKQAGRETQLLAREARAAATGHMQAAGLIPKAPQMVMHHQVPKEILPMLPDNVRRDPRIRGARGTPNRVLVDEAWHRRTHAQGYNQRFQELLTSASKSRESLDAETVLRIRDQAMGEFRGR